MSQDGNIDFAKVEGFDDGWERFDQSDLSHDENSRVFNLYLSILSWKDLLDSAIRIDLGCGVGRRAALAVPRVHRLHYIDPNSALGTKVA